MADNKVVLYIGKELKEFADKSKELKKRDCFKDLQDFIHSEHDGKVLCLYGLRRTGKTTLIRQCIGEMAEEERSKSAYILVTKNSTFWDIKHTLDELKERGFRNIFIDEVTSNDDFISCANVYSDFYGSLNMNIVLSGTDSLSFAFAKGSSLYDRCILIHTTYISFSEFSRVLDVDDIDKYIEYGGTMCLSGTKYNNYSVSAFETKSGTDEYVDSAIAENIQHSLENYNNGRDLLWVQDLYDNNELTGAINRVVEDINHNFTVRVLTKTFKSNDYGSLLQLLQSRNDESLSNADKEQITNRLKDSLKIIEKSESKVEITDSHAKAIKKYLEMLDLVVDMPIVNSFTGEKENYQIFTQPGLRYAQAKALITSITQDEQFDALDNTSKKEVINLLLSDVKGRMMEDIVLFEASKAMPDKDVFKLRFEVGEIDMVVCDPVKSTCEIYEIKHSDKINEHQARHLMSIEKCDKVMEMFGSIEGKYVIYKGKTNHAPYSNDIKYLNVEEYLCGLDDAQTGIDEHNHDDYSIDDDDEWEH